MSEPERAFQRLKHTFTSAPLLQHPESNEPFKVEVDTSNTGVGAVISQREGKTLKMHSVAFFSQKLSLAERNYDVGKFGSCSR